MMDVFREIACPVCGGNSFETLLQITPGEFLSEHRKRYYDLDALGIDIETKFYIKKCKKCTFVFVNPRLRPELYDVVYNEAKIDQYTGKDWAYTDGDLKSLYNTHHKWSAALVLLKLISYLRSRFRHPKSDGYTQIKLLDYGCGYGHVLDLCKVFEIAAFGVEIDRSRIEYCRNKGHSVYRPDELPPTHDFDIVISTSVIEHVDDLNAYFKFISDSIRTGGVFHCNGLTPKRIGIERRRRIFTSVVPTEHINYFTRRSLDLMAIKYGFCRVKPLRCVQAIERPLHYIYPLMKNIICGGFYPNGGFEAEFVKLPVD